MKSRSPTFYDQNFVPDRYRQVSVQPYDGAMTAEAVTAHLMGREAYRRTRYVVLEQTCRCAIAAIERAGEHDEDEALFSPITDVSILALPEECLLIEDETVDTGNPSALAAAAKAVRVASTETLVVRGMDGHVNFIYHPAPLTIRVTDVVPPEPPKLLRMARHVLTYADLPAIVLEAETIDLRDLAQQAPDAEAYLAPCRASGLDFAVPTYFLDEHPARRNWTMLACERSRQIHRHFYGDEAPSIEFCPCRLTHDDGTPQLIKCCQLEENFILDGRRAIVPWGAELKHIEGALNELVTAAHEGV